VGSDSWSFGDVGDDDRVGQLFWWPRILQERRRGVGQGAQGSLDLPFAKTACPSQFSESQLVPVGVVEGADDRLQDGQVAASPGIFHAARDYFASARRPARFDHNPAARCGQSRTVRPRSQVGYM